MHDGVRDCAQPVMDPEKRVFHRSKVEVSDDGDERCTAYRRALMKLIPKVLTELAAHMQEPTR